MINKLNSQIIKHKININYNNKLYKILIKTKKLKLGKNQRSNNNQNK